MCGETNKNNQFTWKLTKVRSFVLFWCIFEFSMISYQKFGYRYNFLNLGINSKIFF